MKSIALVPIILALCFFIFALLLIFFYQDHLEFLDWMIIENKRDAQFILAYVIGGIFTLTIFSYTMVMNVLNRNINNYSPRLVPLLLSEKHHQVILGFTTGTIIYSMVISFSTVSKTTTYYSKIGATLSIVFAIVSVLLFIYFIHSVSQSIHINHITRKVFDNTEKMMITRDSYFKLFSKESNDDFKFEFRSEKTGNLHQPNIKKLLKIVSAKDCRILIDIIPGQFVRRSDILFKSNVELDKQIVENIKKCLVVAKDVALKVPETGFKHFVEIAVKAMSPALNDPGTAKEAIDYLEQLFELRTSFEYNASEQVSVKDKIIINHLTTKKLEHYCYLELNHYLKNDPILSQYLNEKFSRV